MVKRKDDVDEWIDCKNGESEGTERRGKYQCGSYAMRVK